MKLGDAGRYGAPIGRMVSNMVQDDADAASRWLEQAAAQRDTRVMFLFRAWPALTAGSRWPAAARMMNLPAP